MSKILSRREGILALLKERGAITVSDIMERFNVSEATVRRDLETLEQDRRLIRTFGGAVQESARTEVPFDLKMEINFEEKKEIAEKAYGLIQNGDVICLNGGTSCLFVARRIARQPFERLTVVTNALNIGCELAGVPGLELIMTGGVNRTQSFELSGPIADATLERLTIRKAFLGTDGIDPEHGLTTFNELEANTNRMMIRQSLAAYVLADHSKFGHRSVYRIDDLQSISAIITDSGTTDEITSAYAHAGVRFI